MTIPRKGISNVKNVGGFTIGSGALNTLGDELSFQRSDPHSYVLFFVDCFLFLVKKT